jgi:adenylate cyclase
MRITCSYLGTQKVWSTPETEVLFGRAEEDSPIILDLSPDQRVSRLHGRIWEEAGHYWIEDLNSSRGTQLNGHEIKSGGKRQLKPEDSILVGQTALKIDFGETLGDADSTNYLEHGTCLLPEKRHAESGVAIAKDIDATAVDTLPPAFAEDPSTNRHKMVCDLPFLLATKTTLETLLPTIVDRLVDVITTAESWALVLREPSTDVLLLKAYRYVERTYLSETLLRRAMTERKAFIWKREIAQHITGSIAQSGIETGMYAPLLWQGEALGAVCVGARNAATIFTDEDIRLLVLVGQCAAMAVATHRLQEKLRRQHATRSNLLRQFSPKIAEQLLSHRGRLRHSGRRSVLTVLRADVRGFTQFAKELDPDVVVDVFNKYWSVIVPVVFAHQGSISKCMGDSVLAIFGVSDTEPGHQENALRAAFEMRDAVAKLNEELQDRGSPFQDFGIGIHCGDFVHGFLGTLERKEFTVIGDALNETDRYYSAASAGEILISPAMLEHVRRFAETEERIVKTKEGDPLSAYRATFLKKRLSN